MNVNFQKQLRQEAPHLVDTVNMAKDIATEYGLDPADNKAAVLATFDLSGSNEMGNNTNYSSGFMQRVGDLVLASGFAFDDDGNVPFSYFHDSAIDMGNITPATSQGFVERTWRNYPMGGTRYLAALDWIIDSCGLGGIDLGKPGDPLEVKMEAEYPAFAIFASDGEPQDNREAINEKLRRMSQLPIFIGFIGVGNHNFQYLKTLNNLTGRLIDNAGFFDAKEVLSASEPQGRFDFRSAATRKAEEQELILRALLSEFPTFYQNAKQTGLVSR